LRPERIFGALWVGLALSLSTAANATAVFDTTNIALTSGALAPTPRSFPYNSAVLSDPFSDFDADWDGVMFDLTTSANDGPAEAPTGDICISPISPGGAASYVMVTSSGCVHSFVSDSSSAGAIDLVPIEFGDNTGSDITRSLVDTDVANDVGDVNDRRAHAWFIVSRLSPPILTLSIIAAGMAGFGPMRRRWLQSVRKAILARRALKSSRRHRKRSGHGTHGDGTRRLPNHTNA
jgi:hypothetical protein